jgi:hypothetical protein
VNIIHIEPCLLDLSNLTDRDKVSNLRAGNGDILSMVGAMLETSAFFQKQIERCNLLAEQALNQTEQEFWLLSARRWEAILQVKRAKRAVPKPSDLSGELPSRLASSDDQGPVALP